MTMTETDDCVHCGRPTAFNSGSGLFVNRLPTDDGWACAECAGFECDECDEPIYLDTETRVEFEDKDGKFHYGNYHTACYNEAKHGQANYGENIKETK